MQFASLCDMEGVIMKVEHYAAVCGQPCSASCSQKQLSGLGKVVHDTSVLWLVFVCVLGAQMASSVKEEELRVIVTHTVMMDILVHMQVLFIVLTVGNSFNLFFSQCRPHW